MKRIFVLLLLVLVGRQVFSQNNYTENSFGINMKMVYVEGGYFEMGCTEEDCSDCDGDEMNVREVFLSDYYIGQFEITQKQWQAVMRTSVYQQRDKGDANTALCGTGHDYPMYYVTWEEANEFCRILSSKTGKLYRLPTEAEWEYAARGGKNSQSYKYSGSNDLDEVAWYAKNSSSKTHKIGTKKPNELGIYDMSGNVWEWCEDIYSDYRSSDNNNPKGAKSGTKRINRGGSWRNNTTSCRVSDRSYDSPDFRYISLGFRVVCIPREI